LKVIVIIIGHVTHLCLYEWSKIASTGRVKKVDNCLHLIHIVSNYSNKFHSLLKIVFEIFDIF